jgi:hypothetical protein
LKTREQLKKHKEDLKNIIESEISKQVTEVEGSVIQGGEFFASNRGEMLERMREEQALKATDLGFKKLAESDSEKEEIMEEIMTARNHYGTSRKKKKDANKLNVRLNASLTPRFNRAESLAPVIKLIVCQFCSK